MKISFFGHFQREYVWKENWSWKPCSQYPKKRANIAVALSLTAEQFEFIWNCGNLHNKVKLNGKKLPYVSTYHGIVVVQYPNGTCKKNPSYQPYITEDSSEFLAKVNAIFLLFFWIYFILKAWEFVKSPPPLSHKNQEHLERTKRYGNNTICIHTAFQNWTVFF